MTQLTPFLLFGDGNCAEAMAFYRSVFGGELSVIEVRDMPGSDQLPAEQLTKVAYSHLKSDAIEFSGVDWLHPTRIPRPGNTVALYLSEGSFDQLKAIFDQLSVGADPELLDELHDMPFGSYGHLADRYGVHWFFRGEPLGAD